MDHRGVTRSPGRRPPRTRAVRSPAVAPYQPALLSDGLPINSFAVEDVRAEYDRLRALGVSFTQEPADMGPVTTAVFADGCGNLLQIAQYH